MTGTQTEVSYYQRLVALLYSVPPPERRRSHWVMTKEWRGKLLEYARTELQERPPDHPAELLGLPVHVVSDDELAGAQGGGLDPGFPRLVTPAP